jgi:hypothetical protein
MEAQGTSRLAGRGSGNILEFYPEQFRPKPAPVELFRQHVAQWFLAVKHLRLFEVLRLTDGPSPEDIRSHRLVCSALITFGEFATVFGSDPNNNLDLELVGLSLGSIEAETRLLRNNFKMFHDDSMTLDEAENVLGKAFG